MSSKSEPHPSPIPWNLERKDHFSIPDLEQSVYLFWPSFLCICGPLWAILILTSSCLPIRLPADQRRGYKNVFNALIRITREEGVLTLWRVSGGAGDLGAVKSGFRGF